ncbi:MAG: hypothetical protein K8S13_21360 [Desulfobacula sp.]|uniref:FlgD immunoglobulin-like domain containing protein n=1 Tax=Desulfobacula sp. TaxID=2593537 RepID=UPI0025C108C2|nr:FlgD immunoglobulin-like domain containing protein [Desulfobacula sp.]MCD4722382.1 hypothetical protein [Desulfobacula sp.]
MKTLNIILFIALAGLLFSCTQGRLKPEKEMAALNTRPLRITNIRVDKKVFSPEKEKDVSIHFNISKQSQVTVKLYNRSDLLIKTLVKNKELEKGPHKIKWDGTDDHNHLLPPGYYIFTIMGKTNNEKPVVYDPADETGGNLIKARDAQLDTFKGEIRYILPKAGMVRIRAGVENSLLLRTIIDWEPRAAGRQKEPWDGLDQDGLINLFKLPNRQISIFAYSLPDNSIILSRETLKKDFPSKNPPDQNELRSPKKIRISNKFKHSTHDAALCHEPDFQIVFPGQHKKDSEGIPILNGIVPVKIVLSKRDRKHLESSRFEVMFFVDLIFLFEDEEGYTPFTFFWDTSNLPEGEHVFTTNIWSYDDHCGTKSRKVIIRR